MHHHENEKYDDFLVGEGREMATTEAFDFEAEHESEDEHVDRSSQDKEQDPTREHRLYKLKVS